MISVLSIIRHTDGPDKVCLFCDAKDTSVMNVLRGRCVAIDYKVNVLAATSLVAFVIFANEKRFFGSLQNQQKKLKHLIINDTHFINAVPNH